MLLQLSQYKHASVANVERASESERNPIIDNGVSEAPPRTIRKGHEYVAVIDLHVFINLKRLDAPVCEFISCEWVLRRNEKQPYEHALLWCSERRLATRLSHDRAVPTAAPCCHTAAAAAAAATAATAATSVGCTHIGRHLVLERVVRCVTTWRVELHLTLVAGVKAACGGGRTVQALEPRADDRVRPAPHV
eukprot:COSAG06_NODE_512_length_14867_cov_28.794962_10_plen_192_part_00